MSVGGPRRNMLTVLRQKRIDRSLPYSPVSTSLYFNHHSLRCNKKINHAKNRKCGGICDFHCDKPKDIILEQALRMTFATDEQINTASSYKKFTVTTY